MVDSLSAAEEPLFVSNQLYRVGGAAAFLAAVLALAQITIEVIGVGVMGVPVPTSVDGWFALLRSYPLLGLTELTMFQIPVFVLLVPVLLAVSAANRPNRGLTLVALALALVGIAVYLASNTVFSMLSLSGQYAAATTDAQKTSLLAAGQAMLAIYEGVGVDVGLVLVLVAVLMISVLMLRSSVFGRMTAYIGILAGAITMSYYISAAFTPAAIFLLEGAGLFLVVWVILVGRRLYQLGSHPRGGKSQIQ